jgi:ABC-type sulfate transport system permease component
LEKPEKYISISYRYNEHLTFAGTFDPAFLLVIVRMVYTLCVNKNHILARRVWTILHQSEMIHTARTSLHFSRTSLEFQEIGATCKNDALSWWDSPINMFRTFYDPGRAYLG